MLDSELFDELDYVARRLKKPGRPFGGLQIGLCGDFFQLPPVSRNGFAFQGLAWSLAVDETVELNHAMRQEDLGFVRILNEIRWGIVSPASLEALSACQQQHDDHSADYNVNIPKLYLYPRHRDVIVENRKQLESLPGKPSIFNAEVIRHKGKEEEEKPRFKIEKTLWLNWASSVHKCQGMTLNGVFTSLSDVFGHGMIYVALSRVKSMLHLRGCMNLNGWAACRRQRRVRLLWTMILSNLMMRRVYSKQALPSQT